MAVSAKTTSAKELLAVLKKDHGQAIGGFGAKLVNSDRIPTGLFPFDLATGGGFPRGRASMVYGPESSNKTNLALKAIASHQAIWPELTCVFFDIENSLDPAWATSLGVDMDKLIVVKPDYAEQAVDMIESFLHTEDCGLVVVDSLAALMTTAEAEASAEKALVGGNTIVVGKLVRKSTQAFSVADREDRYPSLIYINQVRHKIGVTFGDPETTPGGNAPRFQSALTVRLWGKNITDAKVSQVMPVLKEVSFILRKWKMPIAAASGKFEMATLEHAGLRPGETNDWTQVSNHLKESGELAKQEKGQGWLMLGQPYPTLQACKERVYGDRAFGIEVRQRIIQRVLEQGPLESKDEV